MKKMVATIATGIIIAGAAATTVSAEQYEVKKGDNLWGIANEYNTTIDELVEINGLHTNVIQPKQTLVINEEAEETYVVVKGDTLSRIAKEFDVSAGDIKEWNNLSSDLIVVGQELKMNGVHVAQEAPANDNTEVQTEEANTEVKPEEGTKEEAPAETSNESANEGTQAKEEPKAEQAPAKESTKQANTDNSPEGKTISVSATAYTAECDGCSGVTATGVDLNANPDAKVIAVDPNVIPLGSEVYVEGYGYATAADTGGAINGNKIDLHIPSKDEATSYGVQNVNVTIVE